MGINGITSPDQDEVDSQLRIESHSPIEERLQELIQEIRLTKEQLEQMTSMKHDQLQQARSMKQDQEEIKRYINWQVMILFPIAFIFIFKYLTKH